MLGKDKGRLMSRISNNGNREEVAVAGREDKLYSYFTSMWTGCRLIK